MNNDLGENMKKASDIRKAREKEEDTALRKDIIKAYKTVEAREVPYDGVLGTPPEWVPKKTHLEYESARGWLLDEGFSHQQLLIWINETLDPPPDYSRRALFCPWDDSRDDKIREHINLLAMLWYATSKGEKEGLKIILGKETGEQTIKGKEQKLNLDKGTGSAKTVNTERRKSHDEEWVAWAKEELEKNPKLPINKKLVPIIHKKSVVAGYTFNGRPYAEGTIRNALAGIKKSLKPK